MATDEQGSPLPVRASAEDWGWVESGAWGVRLMRAEVAYRCLVELRDRVAALEVASRPRAPIDDIPSLSELAEMFAAAAQESTPRTVGLAQSLEEHVHPSSRLSTDAAGRPEVSMGEAVDLTELEAEMAAAAAAADHFPDARKMVTPTPTPTQPPIPAPGDGGGLTVEQLAECLPGNAWQNSPEGYSRRAFAQHLLSHPITGPRLRAAAPAAPPAGGVTWDELEEVLMKAYGYLPADHSTAARYILNHPRIGPLLRGEGGKRVVLAEKPPVPEYMTRDPFGAGCLTGYHDGWAAARAEVARQQGEGS